MSTYIIGYIIYTELPLMKPTTQDETFLVIYEYTVPLHILLGMIYTFNFYTQMS